MGLGAQDADEVVDGEQLAGDLQLLSLARHPRRRPGARASGAPAGRRPPARHPPARRGRRDLLRQPGRRGLRARGSWSGRLPMDTGTARFVTDFFLPGACWVAAGSKPNHPVVIFLGPSALLACSLRAVGLPAHRPAALPRDQSDPQGWALLPVHATRRNRSPRPWIDDSVIGRRGHSWVSSPGNISINDRRRAGLGDTMFS